MNFDVLPNYHSLPLSLTLPFSMSACSLSAGLETIGLADIHQVVRLMSLCASGHIQASSGGAGGATHAGPSSHTHPAAQSVPSSDGPASDGLVYLTSAIGAIVQDNANAARLLIQLCTQVRHSGYPRHRENRENDQKKFPVRENTRNLKFCEKTWNLVCLSCKFPDSKGKRYFDICRENFTFFGELDKSVFV